MKAVILAGGEGTRLRPISSSRPKPMVRLFDKPVLEFILAHLKDNGVTDICLTLQYMPQMIREYFGNGEKFGVSLTYFEENEPLGTAGSVKNCASFLGREDFLVLSGDGVCDFDLRKCMAFHREAGAEATVVLYRHQKPLEYGLVLTRKNGKIERFIEKPSWGQVFTNQINTGIYILRSSVLKDIPAGRSYDFARDLFPRLLAEERELYGVPAEGYWCDIGDCEAYLDCAADMLSGKMKWEPEGEKLGMGVWSRVGIPEGVTLLPPCYIGRGAVIGAGSMIGPHTVVGENSFVGRHALVQRTVLDGAHVKERATLYGTVVCRGAIVGRGAVLNEGAVIGEETRVGENATVMERVRVWPNKELEAGSRTVSNLVTGSLKSTLQFGEDGAIPGEINSDLTPELCVLLGAAAGLRGKCAVAWQGGEGARVLAAAVSAGICAAGGEAWEHDGAAEAAAAFAARHYNLPLSIFVRQMENRAELRFFDGDGLPLGREEQRKIEGAAARGECSRADAGRIGRVRRLTGLTEAYAAAAAESAGAARKLALAVSVPRKDESNLTLRHLLQNMGCSVRDGAPGVPALALEPDGLRLRAVDEKGAALDENRLLALLCLIELERGGGKVSVSAGAPAAIEEIGRRTGGRVLRLGRDGREAEELYREQVCLRDGLFAAARLCAHLEKAGETLAALSARAPRFYTRTKELRLKGDPGSVMRSLAESCAPGERELFEGLRTRAGSGWVWVTPLAGRRALRIVGESAEEEIADELCADFERRAKKFDGKPAE